MGVDAARRGSSDARDGVDRAQAHVGPPSRRSPRKRVGGLGLPRVALDHRGDDVPEWGTAIRLCQDYWHAWHRRRMASLFVPRPGWQQSRGVARRAARTNALYYVGPRRARLAGGDGQRRPASFHRWPCRSDCLLLLFHVAAGDTRPEGACRVVTHLAVSSRPASLQRHLDARCDQRVSPHGHRSGQRHEGSSGAGRSRPACGDSIAGPSACCAGCGIHDQPCGRCACAGWTPRHHEPTTTTGTHGGFVVHNVKRRQRDARQFDSHETFQHRHERSAPS